MSTKITLLCDTIVTSQVLAKMDLCLSHSSFSFGGITTQQSVSCRRVSRKFRQLVEVGAVAVFPPAAPATEASTTRRRALLTGTTLLLRHARLDRAEILALRFQLDVVKIFRPVAKRTRLIKVGASDFRHSIL